MVVGALVGLAVMLIGVVLEGADKGAQVIGGTLLNMAVFGAMLSYVMQGLTYIKLKRKFPHIERPYKSPLGNAGAALTVVIALVTDLHAAAGSGVCRRRLLGGGLVCGRHRLFRACRPPQADPVAGGGVRHGARRSGIQDSVNDHKITNRAGRRATGRALAARWNQNRFKLLPQRAPDQLV